ncbi:MAG: LytTR family transcriptional regulator [Euryhalocaulis sp.]|uniref:LytTR family DNA-binding domain-containing protein n=1 Tax=Euryhalocaulis sp. TaxID=2744307 RepID=UPI0017CC4C39|nr:LytTR family DNA-binding domain-containing protein [Euryhalocaulis sp.]MBA4802436.1 LytTR family transcriptional regulator [Euryhalocaulis sp.]
MLGTRRQWLTRILIVLAAGGLLTVLAPYETGQIPVIGRALYWCGLIAVGLASGETIAWGVVKALPEGTHPAVHWLLISLAVSVPVTATVIGVQLLSGGAVRWMDVPLFYFLVWVISAAMTALGVLMNRKAAAEEAARAAPPRASGARFMQRLKPKLRTGTLWAVASEDHYLRVKTDLGEELVLMRLSDAMAELEGVSGLQTHRSWWVAEAGVDAVTKQAGGRAAVRLKDGAEAPVSRANLPKLRDAGWL